MASIKVKLVRGMSGHPEDQRATLRGLGLTRVGHERVLQDTPAIFGAIKKVEFLVTWSRSTEPFKPFGRKARALARAKSARA